MSKKSVQWLAPLIASPAVPAQLVPSFASRPMGGTKPFLLCPMVGDVVRVLRRA